MPVTSRPAAAGRAAPGAAELPPRLIPFPPATAAKGPGAGVPPAPHPGTPQSPEEAFGIRRTPPINQDYLDDMEAKPARTGIYVGVGLLAVAAVVVAVVMMNGGTKADSDTPTPVAPIPVTPIPVAPIPVAASAAAPDTAAPTAAEPGIAPETPSAASPVEPTPPPALSEVASPAAAAAAPTSIPPGAAIAPPTPPVASPVTPAADATAPKARAPAPRSKSADAASKPADDGDDKDVGKILTRANGLYRKGSFKQAIVEFKKALAVDETNDKVHTGLGTAYFDTDQNTLAIQHLKRAIDLNGKNGQAWVILGNVYQAMGDGAKAKAAYESYLKIEPTGKFANDVRLILQAL